MASNNERLGLAMLAVSETRNFWSDNLPDLHTVAGEDTPASSLSETWVRRGEVQAFVLSLGLGVAASLLSSEPWPLVGAFLMSVYMAYQYESALRLGRPNDGV